MDSTIRDRMAGADHDEAPNGCRLVLEPNLDVASNGRVLAFDVDDRADLQVMPFAINGHKGLPHTAVHRVTSYSCHGMKPRLVKKPQLDRRGPTRIRVLSPG